MHLWICEGDSDHSVSLWNICSFVCSTHSRMPCCEFQATSSTRPSARTSAPVPSCLSTTARVTPRTPSPSPSWRSATWSPAQRGDLHNSPHSLTHSLTSSQLQHTASSAARPIRRGQEEPFECTLSFIDRMWFSSCYVVKKNPPPLGAVVDGAFFLHSDGFKEVMPYDHFQPLPR